jgi:hypothetical protein
MSTSSEGGRTRSEESRGQQPSHLPAPKVKMSLRDFALRKKKQREEEMTKNVQDTPSSTGVDLPFGRRKVETTRLGFR